MRSSSIRPLSRPVRRAAVLAGARPGGLLPGGRRAALAGAEPAGLRRLLLSVAAAVLLAGGYLSLEITSDVLRYRIETERAAIERLDEQIRTVTAEIDEARRIGPLDGSALDLLINP